MVGVDILPKKCDFFDSRVRKVPHFIHNAGNVSAALSASSMGHNTVAAHVVAAAHYRDKGIYPTAASAHWSQVCIGLIL